jgi:glyoxylase-like metal-dependent hydrolase (beta-lactamase superfamily II)
MIQRFFHAESSTHTYLIVRGNECIIIDPVLDDVDQYSNLIKEQNQKLAYAIDTHIHADHITALGELRKRHGCITIMGEQSKATCVSQPIHNREVIKFADLEIKALFTPGHTDDSYCYYMEIDNLKYLFTGDTLLINGCGRTDFQNGSSTDLYNSLFTILTELDSDTIVLPAHDYNGKLQSTLGLEFEINPRLNFSCKEEFVEFMDNLKLPDPKLMDVAVTANKNCGISH